MSNYPSSLLFYALPTRLYFDDFSCKICQIKNKNEKNEKQKGKTTKIIYILYAHPPIRTQCVLNIIIFIRRHPGRLFVPKK